jgi:hypothetical protein
VGRLSVTAPFLLQVCYAICYGSVTRVFFTIYLRFFDLCNNVTVHHTREGNMTFRREYAAYGQYPGRVCARGRLSR